MCKKSNNSVYRSFKWEAHVARACLLWFTLFHIYAVFSLRNIFLLRPIPFTRFVPRSTLHYEFLEFAHLIGAHTRLNSSEYCSILYLCVRMSSIFFYNIVSLSNNKRLSQSRSLPWKYKNNCLQVYHASNLNNRYQYFGGSYSSLTLGRRVHWVIW